MNYIIEPKCCFEYFPYLGRWLNFLHDFADLSANVEDKECIHRTVLLVQLDMIVFPDFLCIVECGIVFVLWCKGNAVYNVHCSVVFERDLGCIALVSKVTLFNEFDQKSRNAFMSV